MGKGGDHDITARIPSAKVEEDPTCKVYNQNNANRIERAFKLGHLSTEELRKWSRAYALNEELERDELLQQLVSIE